MHFVVSPLEDMEGIKTASMDSVLSVDVMCSVNSPAEVVREMARVVKPGGLVMLAEHGRVASKLVNCGLYLITSCTYPLMGVSYIRDMDQIMAASGLEIVENVAASSSTFRMWVAVKPQFLTSAPAESNDCVISILPSRARADIHIYTV